MIAESLTRLSLFWWVDRIIGSSQPTCCPKFYGSTLIFDAIRRSQMASSYNSIATTQIIATLLVHQKKRDKKRENLIQAVQHSHLQTQVANAKDDEARFLRQENQDDYHTINFGACYDQPVRIACALCYKQIFPGYGVDVPKRKSQCLAPLFVCLVLYNGGSLNAAMQFLRQENQDDYHTINFGACYDQPARIACALLEFMVTFFAWISHMIYYHGNQKYPCQVGTGSSQFLVLLASFRFEVLNLLPCFCLLAIQWFCRFWVHSKIHLKF